MPVEIRKEAISKTSSGLFVVDPSPSVVPNGGIQILESGIAIASGPSVLEPPDQLVLPQGVVPLNKNRLALPLDFNLSLSLIIPTDSELLKVIPPAQESENRSSADIAVAFMKPKLFIANEVRSEFAGNPSLEIAEVLSNLTGEEFKFKKSHIQRKTETYQYYDKDSEEQKTVTKTTPGAFESVALTAINLLEDPNIKANAKDVVFKPISDLLEKYRLKATKNERHLPEMPDLCLAIIAAIDKFPAITANRFNLYSLLEQIKLPASLQEELMIKMDKNNDLDHPLAFETTHALSSRSKESPWVNIQNERRQQLLSTLAGSAQEVFERYDDISKLSEGLVISTNLNNPETGKVGLEIETRLNVRPDYDSNARLQYMPINGLPNNQWRVHPDGINDEITRADEALAFGPEYVSQLIDLSKWFKDNANILASLHIHFDRTNHPKYPDLSKLYEDHQETVRRNSLGTWELRFLNLPKSLGSFHPGRLTDGINLFLEATKPVEGSNSEKPKLTAIQDKKYSLSHLIFGHISREVDSPEGRLAVLMALHDSTMLKSINPLTFANSIEEKDLGIVADSLEGQFKSTTDLEMMAILRRCATVGVVQVKADVSIGSPLYTSLATKVLGVEMKAPQITSPVLPRDYAIPDREFRISRNVNPYLNQDFQYFSDRYPDLNGRPIPEVNEVLHPDPEFRTPGQIDWAQYLLHRPDQDVFINSRSIREEFHQEITPQIESNRQSYEEFPRHIELNYSPQRQLRDLLSSITPDQGISRLLLSQLPEQSINSNNEIYSHIISHLDSTDQSMINSISRRHEHRNSLLEGIFNHQENPFFNEFTETNQST